jgi:hypothetical protein
VAWTEVRVTVRVVWRNRAAGVRVKAPIPIFLVMGLLPELKRRPRLHNDTSRESAKWGWYIMVIFVVAWFVYSLWFDK